MANTIFAQGLYYKTVLRVRIKFTHEYTRIYTLHMHTIKNVKNKARINALKVVKGERKGLWIWLYWSDVEYLCMLRPSYNSKSLG